MKHFELKGQVREAGNKAVIKSFRREGLVPCNLYGQGVENILFTVTEKDLKGLTHTPYSYIVDIVLDNGEKYFAIMHELQFHPVTDKCLHVDFLHVTEDKPITISVPVLFTGHSIGVKQGGKFKRELRQLRINAMMNDLPDNITVDITKLKLEGQIVAGDVHVDNVNICIPAERAICRVLSSRNITASEEEEEEEEEATETESAE